MNLLRNISKLKDDNIDARLLLVNLVSLVAALATVVLMLNTLSSPVIDGVLVKKEPIEKSFQTAIKHGAGLTEIRHIFEREKKVITKSLITVVVNGFKDSATSQQEYFTDSSLTYVLADLIASEYTKEKFDPDYVKKLQALLNEHEKQNPFDKLEIGQRQYFENIEAKIPTKVYEKIQQDINKLVDQLDTKNRLVSEYLSDSTFSLRVSLGALGFSFLFGFYQLYLGRKKRTKETILEVLNAHQNQ